MKKLIISLFLWMLGCYAFSKAGPNVQQKTFRIHTEKRMFIKKMDREKHNRHRRHHRARKMADRQHFMEHHKK